MLQGRRKFLSTRVKRVVCPGEGHGHSGRGTNRTRGEEGDNSRFTDGPSGERAFPALQAGRKWLNVSKAQFGSFPFQTLHSLLRNYTSNLS